MLSFDLLTHKEEEYDRRTAELRFDTSLFAARLTGAQGCSGADSIHKLEIVPALPISSRKQAPSGGR
jgi:hypothetical protein